jgi:hypothetical protein
MKPVPILIAVLAAAALAVAAAPRSDAAAAAATARFAITIDGYEIASFSGLRLSATTAVLTDGTGTPALRSWALTQKRADPEVVMYNAKGERVAGYFLENAWPTKLDFGASAGQVLSITLCHEGFEIR